VKTIFNTLDKRSNKYIWLLSLLMVVILSGLVFAFSAIVFFEPFYVLPITLASWYGSKKSGLLLALLSVLVLILVKELAFQGNFDIENIIYYGLPYAISFSGLAILITNFRSVHKIEATAADTDDLTSINNPRSFYAELANELVRSFRYKHIFSLAYIDIDDFKNINDTLGHSEGDRLLVEVANCLKSSLRQTDTVARLGGDEFACLLPETEQKEAKIAFSKAIHLLQERMKKYDWSVSFSVGLVTFDTPPGDIKEAIKITDDLMYSVKNNEKDNIAFKIWHGKAFS
jgi:diguanylate cyclase (GGDEF)-like protein